MRIAALLLVTLAPMMAAAQAAPSAIRPPALVVELRDRHEPLRVTRAAVDARVVGGLAETRMTLTFHNPHDRNLEGELFFPLPEGATVTGYALDVGGVMVDGVAVPKQVARQVFEAEVRKGIDPGLVEYVGGNQFRTRIFPLPAGGTRTVMVRWVSGLVDTGAGHAYQLPLAFQHDLEQLSVRVEVVQAEQAPVVVHGGPRGLTFEKTRQSFIAEATVENTRPDRDLLVRLPGVEQRPVHVMKGSDGATWFSVHDAAVQPRPRPAVEPRRIRVIWDASGSRARADHDRELRLLDDYLKGRDVAVEVVILRHEAEPVQRFALPAQRDALLRTLHDVAYDGGTRLSALADAVAGRAPGMLLVFTDGIGTFGRNELPSLRAPAFVIGSASGAAHETLRALASGSGGAYFNLAQLPDAQVLPKLGRTPYSYLGTEVAGDAEVYPRAARPVTGSSFTLAGRLTGDEATLTIRYGVAGEAPATRTVTVRASDAVEGDLLRQAWAMAKVADLMALPDENADAIEGVGREHQVVTPRTSLLVLERLEQYVEYGIRPPASLPNLVAAFDAAVAERAKVARAEEQSKLEHVLQLWRERVAWWETTFEVPPGFEYRQVAAKKNGAARAARAEPAPGNGDADEIAEDGASDSEAKEKEKNDAGGGRSIAIKPWDPQTPYLAALKAAPKERRLAVYLGQRAELGDSPAFYVDVAAWLLREGERALALRVLSNLAELELENPALLRVLAHQLEQMDELDLAIQVFEQVRRLRPDEPQSHRDLALVLARRGEVFAAKREAGRARVDFDRALELLAHVVMNRWDRFDAIEVIALTELNNVLPKARRVGVKREPVDARLIKPLDMDVRIVMSWDADLTDMDLHVVEPFGEEAYYSHNRTTIGGLVSRDFTQGYGPEVYAVRKGMKGRYTVRTKYFGSSAAKLAGGVTLQVTVFTDYGRPTEKRQSLTLRLTENKEMFTVGEVTL